MGGALLLEVYLSSTDSTAGALSGRFVGWQNFELALSDPMFRKAVVNTAVVSLAAPVIPVAPFVGGGRGER